MLKTKNCKLCGASFIPDLYNQTQYCNDCLKRQDKHFFVEDDIIQRKFHNIKSKGGKTNGKLKK